MITIRGIFSQQSNFCYLFILKFEICSIQYRISLGKIFCKWNLQGCNCLQLQYKLTGCLYMLILVPRPCDLIPLHNLIFCIIILVRGPCDPNPCRNGGTCNDDSQENITCTCAIGFKGDTCQIGKITFLLKKVLPCLLLELMQGIISKL